MLIDHLMPWLRPMRYEVPAPRSTLDPSDPVSGPSPQGRGPDWLLILMIGLFLLALLIVGQADIATLLRF